MENEKFLKLLDEAKSYGWQLRDEKRTYTDFRGAGPFITLPLFTTIPPKDDPRGKWTWTLPEEGISPSIQRLTLDGKDCFIDVPAWFEDEVIKDRKKAEDLDQSTWSWIYDLIWVHYATKGESPF